jgi:predicted nucleic acid-binding protein
MRTIIDSSAWIELFNDGDSPIADHVAQLVEADDAIITGMIRCEVLVGFKSDAKFKRASTSLDNFERLDDGAEANQNRAIAIYRKCRKKGVTVRSLVDCLIAAAALENDLPILHRDRDFDAIAAVFPLRIAEERLGR